MTNKQDTKEERPLGELLAELEASVRWFDTQDAADVEAGLAKVRRGAELIKELRERLKRVENEFAEVASELDEDRA